MSQGRLSSAGTLVQSAAEAIERSLRAPHARANLTPSNVRPLCDALLQGHSESAEQIRSAWLAGGGLPVLPGLAPDADLTQRAIAALKLAGQNVDEFSHGFTPDQASSETQLLLQRADLAPAPKTSWLGSIFSRKNEPEIRYFHPLRSPGELEHEGVAVAELIDQQEQDGSWSGRFGVNYIRGTSEALRVLREAGLSDREAPVLRAGEWIRSIQNGDGGWGESPASYREQTFVETGSSPVQTSWALLGLIDGGDTTSLSLESGIEYLLRNQRPDGTWLDPSFFVTIEPGVLYANDSQYPVRYGLLALQSFVAAKQKVAHS